MRILFTGTGEIGVPALRALLESEIHHVVGVITQPDRAAGRHQELLASPVKQMAFLHHVSVYQPEKINTTAVLEQINYLKPDIMVVCAYGQILKSPILKSPRVGCLNLHASLLPKYRGSSCIQAAIKNGDAKSGMTVMWMDEGLDTGDIFLQEELKLARDETAGTLHDRLASQGPSLLLSALDLIGKGKTIRKAQSTSQATYVKKLSKADGHVDWNFPQVEVEAHIRSMIPWPGAFNFLNMDGEKKSVKIFQTIISNRAKGSPGEILRIDEHGILVAAGEGGLLLREVQLEGRKRMKADEMARGIHLTTGMFLE
ncbi:MAG: methionyl-tRNA formyltransferase [Blastochloris sp.]|nr:methionyl-tRNA formyltransferase [Blastochloris sp.]